MSMSDSVKLGNVLRLVHLGDLRLHSTYLGWRSGQPEEVFHCEPDRCKGLKDDEHNVVRLLPHLVLPLPELQNVSDMADV